MDAFTTAIASAGSHGELCRRLSAVPGAPRVTPQTLSGWISRGQVPETRVWQFSQATGIPPWDVRPDIYDRPEIYLRRVAEVCGG